MNTKPQKTISQDMAVDYGNAYKIGDKKEFFHAGITGDKSVYECIAAGAVREHATSDDEMCIYHSQQTFFQKTTWALI